MKPLTVTQTSSKHEEKNYTKKTTNFLAFDDVSVFEINYSLVQSEMLKYYKQKCYSAN